jgi:ribosomal protein S18 acetylase RimI-like enzyme
VEGSAKPGVVRDFISDSLNHPAPSGHPSTGGDLKIFLEVAADNIAAQRLYERNGYKQIAIRSKYYDGKTDAIIMQKILH